VRGAASNLEGALDRLGAVAQSLTGRVMSAHARSRFSRYADLVHLWNRTHNLTALRSPAEIVRGLFEDSLLLLRLVPTGATRVIDIGAGAGIPGVPLHLVDPRLAVVLIEARQKRVSFLKTLKRELELDDRVTVLEGRAEAILGTHPEYRANADAVVARGVGQPEKLMPVAGDYVKPGGLFIATGPPASEVAGLDRIGWTIVELPEFGLKRAFMVRAP
jgi:16S rRNA (guanine527-N7)-methyltransferase